MKRLMTLILALVLLLAVFCPVGASTFVYAEESEPGATPQPEAEAEEPVNPYVGLWKVAGIQEGETYLPYEGDDVLYFDFLPNGVVYGVMVDAEYPSDDYFAYAVTGENALLIISDGDPIPCEYDPEMDVITMTVEDGEQGYALFLKRLTEEPLPDIYALVDRSDEEQEYYGYQIRNESQAMDLVDFIAIMDEDPDDYYYMILDTDGTGFIQVGSEELSGDIRWNETQIIVIDEDGEESPAPYVLENRHILIDVEGTIMDFAPAGEVLALIELKKWELENAPIILPEEMEGVWELTKFDMGGLVLTAEQMDTSMSFILGLNGTVILYSEDSAPSSYRLAAKDEAGTLWALTSGGVELYELAFDGTVLTMDVMGFKMIFEKTEG